MKFVIQKSKSGKYYFVLKAKNGETIATSEMYNTVQACKKGVSSVKRVALFAKTVDLTLVKV